MRPRKMWLNINGADRMVVCDPETDTLARVLRRLGLTSVKVGCDTGVCGSCSVILGGRLVRSCARKMKKIEEYTRIITLEGIGTPDHLHPLQVAWMHHGAVQCGFCSPGFIVSAYALLLENDAPTREQVRDWFQKHRNVCRCTGYKQLVDAVMDAARVVRREASIDDITCPPPEDNECYGKPLVRPGALAKVTGLADYGEDIALKMPQETLHVAVVQPRVAHHARILDIDTGEALKMPGVVKVITHQDIKANGGTNQMAEANLHERSTVTLPSRKILCDDKIFRYGDVVALAIAHTPAQARAAAARVTVKVEPLPEYLTYLDAVMPDAVRVHDDTPNLFCCQPVLKGDALADAETVPDILDHSACSVEGSFHSSREPHLSIEGCTVQAYFDEDDCLTFQCKSQGLYTSISRIGSSLGVPRDKLRVINNFTGASFGWSTNAGDLCLAGAAAVAVNGPVALSLSYEEHQHFSGKRCPSYSNGRVACDENGRITAAEFDIGLDHGAYSWGGDHVMEKPVRFAFFPYKIPHVAGMCRVANTNHTFGTAYRSYGSPQAYTMSEALMDMLAEKMNIDPFEFRWINIARPGDTNINSHAFKEYPMEEMMEKMRPHYEKAVADARAADTPEKRRGVGLAWGGFNVTEGGTDQCTVVLELDSDDRILKYDTWQDLGQGGDVGSLMVTLEALKPMGVTPDRVRLCQNDTGICPDSGMSAASRSHYMNGHATKMAADKLMAAMKKPDGTFRTHAEMTAENIDTRYEATYTCTVDPSITRLDPNTGVGDPTPAYTYVLNMAEVEVDTATGKTTVIRFVCVYDVGKVGNIAAVSGQAYGGISHSIGFALSEDYSDVKKHTNIAKSGVPYIKDIPDHIVLIPCENPRKDGPFGSSGASEAFQSSGHVAVINAIYNACKVRIFDLPARPEKVKAGLDALAAGTPLPPPKKYFLGSDLYEELENIKANPVKFRGHDMFNSLGDEDGTRFF
jgi:aldehyde oxidoreductase